MSNNARKRVGDGRQREVGGHEKGKRRGKSGKVSTLTDSM